MTKKEVLCNWNGGACNKSTNHKSGLCAEHRRVEQIRQLSGNVFTEAMGLAKRVQQDDSDFLAVNAAVTDFVQKMWHGDYGVLHENDLMDIAVRMCRKAGKTDKAIKSLLETRLAMGKGKAA